jgi:hypothetical protein
VELAGYGDDASIKLSNLAGTSCERPANALAVRGISEKTCEEYKGVVKQSSSQAVSKSGSIA